jgi:hypothetical protein
MCLFHLLYGNCQQERHNYCLTQAGLHLKEGIYRHINENENIALLPLEEVEYFRKNKRTMTNQEYGVWVVDIQYGVKGSVI